MAYTPYQSDAPPPPAGEWEPPTPKRWPWITALALVVGGLSFAFYWVSRPKIVPPPAPPLAMIPLAGGLELRLVHAVTGQSFTMSSKDDFAGRVRWDSGMRNGPFGGVGHSSSTMGGSGTNSAWLVFSIYDPKTKEFSRPKLKDAFIFGDDKRVRFEGQESGQSGNALPPVQPVSFSVISRRSAELNIEFEHQGTTYEEKIPNPFLTQETKPKAVAKPLPQSVEVEGVTVELKSVVAHSNNTTTNGKSYESIHINASISATEAAVPGAKFSINREFFDSSGNTSYNILPFDDEVWGMRVTVIESADYPYAPERITSLGKVKFPAAGEAMPLTLPSILKENGITEGFFFGPAQLNWANGNLTTSVNGGASKNVGKVSQKRSNSWSLSGPGIGFFSQGHDGLHATGGILRIKWKDKVIGAQSQGSTSDGQSRVEFNGWYAGFFSKDNKGPESGDEVEVEFVVPKKRNAELFFERPELPAKK